MVWKRGDGTSVLLDFKYIFPKMNGVTLYLNTNMLTTCKCISEYKLLPWTSDYYIQVYTEIPPPGYQIFVLNLKCQNPTLLLTHRSLLLSCSLPPQEDTLLLLHGSEWICGVILQPLFLSYPQSKVSKKKKFYQLFF